MKYTPHCLALVGVGLVLVIAGMVWSRSVGNQMAWTEKQANNFSEVSAAYHQAAYAHGATDQRRSAEAESASAKELAAVKAAWEAQVKQRDDAIAWRDFWKNALFFSGMAAIVIGGGGYLIVKNTMDED